MFEQNPKRRIDLGQIGNASTGDILYDGGEKVNSNFDAIYNAFADQRFMSAASGESNMVIHATGYYQKVNQQEFRTPIKLGSQYDVDASQGSVSPILPRGKKGEGCVFVDFGGTVSTETPLVIYVSDGAIDGAPDGLRITTPYTKVEVWCVSDVAGAIKWKARVSSLFGESLYPIEETIEAVSSGTRVKIAHISQYRSVKLLLTASNPDGTKLRQSEVNLLVDTLNKKVYHTEFAVQRVGATENDDFLTLEFTVDQTNTIYGIFRSTVRNLKVGIKTLSAHRLGAN